MAFFSKVGNILKQSVSKQVTSLFPASNPSIYQALRCMSSSKLFIGGLPWAVDDSSLRETFSKYGEVIEARVIVDRENNRSRGFGFVTFASSEEASSAIQAMDQQDMQGRRVRVNYATDRAPRSGGYGGGGYGGGYGGGQSYGGGGYGGGQNYGGNSGGYAPSGTSSFAGGSYGTAGGNTAETGFASSGFEGGSADQFGSNSNSGYGDDIGDLSSKGGLEENFADDDDLAKRA